MELLKTAAALVLNAAIVWMELHTLRRLTHKKDILKYYTYLSNLVAAVAGALYVAVTLWVLVQGAAAPLWLKGLRFTATYMLVATLFVFNLVLLPGGKAGNAITEEDFTGISPKLANLILHYLCPVISAVSLLLLERQPVLTDPNWTLFSIAPTILYWMVYLILTASGLWKDPYGFSEPSEKPKTLPTLPTGILMFLLIPVMSVGLHYLLWQISSLNF